MRTFSTKIPCITRRFACLLVLLILLLVPLLAACGPSSSAQQTAPTPTPLPVAPALERSTYIVQRGPIEQLLEVTGRVTPVDLQQLSFKVEGRVVNVKAKRGDPVKAGDVLAELELDDVLDTLRQAEYALAQAQRDLEDAKAQQEVQVEQAELSVVQAQKDAVRAQQEQADRIKQAQNNLTEAQHVAQQSRQQDAERIAQAEIELERAQARLARLLPNGPEDRVKAAQDALDAAKHAAEKLRTNASEAKTAAEDELRKAAQAVQDAQHAYSRAFWNNAWVEQHGTDPTQPMVIDPVSGEHVPNTLTDAQKAEYVYALIVAERNLHEAERNVDLAQRALDQARADEIQLNQHADKQITEAQRALDQVLADAVHGDPQLVAARQDVQDAQRAMEAAKRRTTDQQARVKNARVALEAAKRGTSGSEQTAVKVAELGVESAQQGQLNIQQTAVEQAQLALDKARRKVDAARVIAPRDGVVLAVAISEGELVEAFAPVVEIADPSRLELAAELSGEQMRQLAEGRQAMIRLLAQPDIALPATIRRLPAPYGAGGSGAVQEQDKTTRFAITDPKRQTLVAGAVAKITIVLEYKGDVLWLPPDAVRSFEGRRFVVIRQNDRERRVPVRVGIETDARVELLDGVKQGDMVVGP